FEALCTVGPFEIAHGFVNAITPAYHWHLALKRFRHLRSHDEAHARSGRRVLVFTPHEDADAAASGRIYVRRAPGAAWEPDREARVAAARGALRAGAPVELEAGA